MTFDIVEVLKVGLSGLAFLFIFLGYRLLSKEQTKTSSDERILRHIKVFIWQSIFLTVIVGGTGLAQIYISSKPTAGNSIEMYADMITECRRGLSSLQSLSSHEQQTLDSIRLSIQNYHSRCNPLFEALDK